MRQPANGKTYDLVRFSRRLQKRGVRHHALTKAISKFAAAASRVSDLKQAQKSLSMLFALMEKPNDMALLGAVFTDALLHYCRAIYTKGRSQRFKYYEDFDAAEKAAHDDLTMLRDKVIAHYTPETKIGGRDWVPATAAVREIGTSLGITFATTRHFGDERRAHELQLVTARALELAKAHTDDCAEELEGLLLAARKDPEIKAMLEDCEFDIGEILQDPAELSNFWDPQMDAQAAWAP